MNYVIYRDEGVDPATFEGCEFVDCRYEAWGHGFLYRRYSLWNVLGYILLAFVLRGRTPSR